jgi:hypothetical protein
VPDPNPVWRQRAAEVLAQPKGSPNLVFLGDSILYHFEHAPGAPVWDAHIGPLGARDLAVPFSLTENVLYLINRGVLDGIRPAAVVLLIGTNNFFLKDTPAQVAAGIEACVAAIRARLPHAGILVMGLLPRGRDPHDPRRWEIPQVNRLVASLGALPGVRFLDAGAGFLNPDGTIKANLLPDFTHPSPAGYFLLTNDLRPDLEAFLGHKVP